MGDSTLNFGTAGMLATMPNELDRRLEIVRAILGWKAIRVEGYREGFQNAFRGLEPSDFDTDLGFDCGRLSTGSARLLGVYEGYRHGASIMRGRMPELFDGDESLSIAQSEHDAGMKHFDATDAKWSHDRSFDVERLLVLGSRSTAMSMHDRSEWTGWIVEEHRDSLGDGRAGYADLVLEDILDPIVVALYEDDFDIWDGWHRFAATIAKEASGVSAIWCRSPVAWPEGPVCK